MNQVPRLFAALSLCILFSGNILRAEELCVYFDERGKAYQTHTRAAVPEKHQANLRCFEARKKPQPTAVPKFMPFDWRKNKQGGSAKPGAPQLSAPQDIELSGNLREVDIGTPLGRVLLRWPRKVEQLFGRTPERAMIEAARTISKALRQNSFPPRVAGLNLEWQVVFMDAELPETQIPAYLRNNCHPAWMTPPANLYIVSQRISGNCGESRQSAQINQRVNDAQLTQVLVHEIGHAVEFYMLGGKAPLERMRSEGFATWFEHFAANYSSLLSATEIKRQHDSLAAQAIAANPDNFVFQGSGADYARASLYFRLLVTKRGIAGLNRMYEQLCDGRVDFMSALADALGLSLKQINSEVRKLVRA